MQAKAEWAGLRRPFTAAAVRPALPKVLGPTIDAAIWIGSPVVALWLLGGLAHPTMTWVVAFGALALLVLLKALTAQALHLNAQTWGRFGFADARNVLLAAVVMAAVGSLVTLAFGVQLGVPANLAVVDGMLTGLLMFAARGGARHVGEARLARQVTGKKPHDVLLIGAGEAGSLLAREMLRHPETGMRPVGFIDEDTSKAGRTIAGVPVLGRLANLAEVFARVPVDEVLIAIPSADGRAVRRIIEAIREASPDTPYRTMPALHELISGRVTVSRIRDVGIEDLLRRPPVHLDTQSILSYLQGKRIMITGAGGSIGSELVRQICRFAPGELILFGHGENSIYQLERELDLHYAGTRYHSVIAAVQNLQRLDAVFRRHRPDVVFHAAAHKHVPLMEINPEEAVFNNVVGSRNVVQLALRHGVTHLVNVSTDKAVNASSVMGASKRLVELIVENASRSAGPDQVFLSVRFGNVLGSRGSAVTLFKEQIRNGGPVTVTHPEMRRYFMTIPEAAQLVLQASAQGRNGEIYILDMGEPVRVVDLARDLIRLSGLEPGVDMPIVFTGIRPGEKLFEELMSEEEKQNRTQHEHIVVARSATMPAKQLDGLVERLVAAAMDSDEDGIRRAFAAGVGALDAGAQMRAESGASAALGDTGDDSSSRPK